MSSPQDSNAPPGLDPRIPEPERGQPPPGPPAWGSPPAGGWGQPGDADPTHALAGPPAGPWNPPPPTDPQTPPGRIPGAGLPPAGQTPPGPPGPAGPPPWPGHGPPGPAGFGGGPAGPPGPGSPYPPGWNPYPGRPGGQPPWGPGYPPPPQPPQKRSATRLIVAGVIAVGLVVVAILGFVTPGFFVTKVFDATAVESGVARIMSQNYGIDGDIAVDCPEGVKVAEGTTFTCTATVDGDELSVPIRVSSAQGDYEVGRPA